jgi:hypothetical protein
VGEFETCKNLITMMDAGMIEPVGINPVGDRRNGGRSPKILKNIGGYLLLGALSLALIFQLFGVRGKMLPLSPREDEGWKTLRQPGTTGREKGHAADVVWIEQIRYPVDTFKLVKTGSTSGLPPDGPGDLVPSPCQGRTRLESSSPASRPLLKVRGIFSEVVGVEFFCN